MTYVAPALEEKFNTLSDGLKNMILERNTKINTLQDLINVLEDIVHDSEADK